MEAVLRDKKPLNMGTRTDGLLARFDAARGQYVPEETATFLFQTREGSYGIIFVGVDDSWQPGAEVATPNDELNPELNPTWSHKGRRFTYALITGP